MFTQLNEEAADSFSSGNAAVANGLDDALAGIRSTFVDLFGESRDQLFSLPTMLQVHLNGQAVGFDPLLTADAIDDLAAREETMTSAIGAAAPVAAVPTFEPGDLNPDMGGSLFGTYTSIYGENGTAWYDSIAGTGGANAHLSLVSPTTAGVRSESLLASASFATGNGQGQIKQFQVDGTYSKVFTNGDLDNWSVDLDLSSGGLTGNFEVSSKRGPLTVAGQVLFWNSAVSSVNIDVNYVMPGEEFHLHYNHSDSHTSRSASYRNTTNENVTLLADYGYDSSIGTAMAVGTGYWKDERNYFESIIARYEPLNGPAHSAALIKGALRTNQPDLSLVFSVAVTDDVMNQNPVVDLIPYLNVPMDTKWTFRGMMMLDYDNLRESVLGGQAIINY